MARRVRLGARRRRARVRAPRVVRRTARRGRRTRIATFATPRLIG